MRQTPGPIRKTKNGADDGCNDNSNDNNDFDKDANRASEDEDPNDDGARIPTSNRNEDQQD